MKSYYRRERVMLEGLGWAAWLFALGAAIIWAKNSGGLQW